MKNDFLRKMPKDKINLHRIKDRVEMTLFLSFLKIPVKRGAGHLGEDNGWTRHYGENKLIIGGGFIKKIEYLDSIQYGYKLDNPYNNYVNPFYLFDIMSQEGKEFFLNHYSDEIKKEIAEARRTIERAEKYKTAIFSFLKDSGVGQGLQNDIVSGGE